jgi:hypothetical protein
VHSATEEWGEIKQGVNKSKASRYKFHDDNVVD